MSGSGVRTLWGVATLRPRSSERTIVSVHEDEQEATTAAAMAPYQAWVVPLMVYPPGAWHERHRREEE